MLAGTSQLGATVYEIGKISAQAGAWGSPDRVSYMLPMEPQLDYFEGEPD